MKAARERRGVTLAGIAETTKVCSSHFAALERGDLRRWPKGLFRRAFFRGYVGMIGLPVAETMDEFVRLFPDDETAPVPARPEPAAIAPRLALDTSWHEPKEPIRSRLAAAGMDAGAVTLVAIGIAWWAGRDFAPIAALVAVSYFTLATVLLGDSAAACLMRWHRRRAMMPQEASEEAPARDGVLITRAWHRIVEIATEVFEPGGEDETAGGLRAGEERPWTTDARRIRPRDIPPRLRVRFKWSP